MDPSLHDLIARLDQLSDGFAELRDGVRKAVLVADLDPEMALTRARKVLEYVVRDVFERRVQEPPGTRPLENLLQRLVKDGFFPDRLDAYASTVRKLGNVGTHNFGARITAGDVYQSLTQLMPILEWYFEVERPDSGVRLTAPRAQEPPVTAAAPAPTPAPAPAEPRIAVVPKGLRSFDANDARFFLELLPGPRDEHGLPESLRFWKHRVEPAGELTFAVGVIYGPSGCGKSSLVKAGLLPHLAGEVVPVYVEATPDETETRLLAGLRKRVPALPTDLDLAQTLTALRLGEGSSPPDRPPVFLVLDQFEQWLHAHRGESGTALAQALRQCDGERLRCVLMVRDDFWMALTRFLDELGVELVQGQNAAAVDLFDLIHARKVLVAFGRAFGRLPEASDSLTADQSAFLEQAIGWLAQDGRVISIRLALFAEMVKGKDWTGATLAEAGNMERIGVAFLDETFRAATLRHHEKPAQAVLKALLPERGTDIKGHMRSYDALRAAAGPSVRPDAFDALLRTLDREVRLITPTDPEGQASDDESRPAAPQGRFYQLTHDYLVPALREWITRKQRETRRGRAELRLAERAALWRARPENRFLPSPGEWCRIRLFTRAKEWTEPQRRMMGTAFRVHGARALGLALVIALAILAGMEAYSNLRAAALVDSLRRDPTSEVPALATQLARYRRWAQPRLERLAQDLQSREGEAPAEPHAGDTGGSAGASPSRETTPTSTRARGERLNACLALYLLGDRGQLDYLYGRLLQASPGELPVICGALEPDGPRLVARLRGVLNDARVDPDRRFAAACALARYDAGRSRTLWDAAGSFITDRLLASVLANPAHYTPLISMLRPVRERLVAPLSVVFRDQSRAESERSLATNILADYASDQPGVLADLLMDADAKPFAVLFASLRMQSQRAVPLLRSEVAKKPASDATAESQEQLAWRQARAAVALLRLGQAEDVWGQLRHSPDPTVRSFLVHWLRPLGADPKVLAAKLEELARAPSPAPPAQGTTRMDAVLFDPVTSLRRALILALGEYTEDLPAGLRDELTATLLDAYRNDPDAGIHGAAEWTLRQWNQEEALTRADADLRQLHDWGPRRWRVNSEGQTMSLIEGPVTFTMGSPPTEPGRFDDETPHPQRINRTFGIAAKEVTREQFERFVRADPKNQKHVSTGVAAYSPDLQGPQLGVTWYDAAAYCNWLSAQEKLEACYEPNEKGEYTEGMKIAADFRTRSGYRLPTEAEWEYACRAGTVTSRYYGGSLDLLGEYAWYLQNSTDTKARRCGRLKPNELGLFDVLGNAYEWCQDQSRSYRQDEGIAGDDKIIISTSIIDKNSRLLRGGSFTSPPANVRAADRSRNAPASRGILTGFRPARTYH
jgi:formylglycine-generating enzyme required for sulfatase activity